mmetsp:Transcript_92381/g.270438  ORF Transcript_92381/g.270438 Transcript_92381/m.270438 type:complete len:86 (+) Transcript_92381:61-318(+)
MEPDSAKWGIRPISAAKGMPANWAPHASEAPSKEPRQAADVAPSLRRQGAAHPITPQMTLSVGAFDLVSSGMNFPPAHPVMGTLT